MTIPLYINLACWLIFVLYWLANAWAVKRTKEVKAGLGYVRWIVVIAAFLLMRFKVLSGATLLLPRSDIVTALGVVLSIAGVAIAIAARRRLAGNWSSGIVLKEGHELITIGLYNYVRHPIYSGILLMALGAAMVNGTLAAMMFLVVVLLFLAYKATQEEQLLTKEFPDEYPAYKARTNRVVPWVW
jgi:protein-S-isoprenylcysteine O-methyltransferase Ste14